MDRGSGDPAHAAPGTAGGRGGNWGWGGDRGPSGMRAFGWEWGRDEDRRPRVPWIGVFLVVFGGLLLVDRVLPEYRSLGNIVVLAAGLAFLVVWAIRRDTFPLYAGAFLTAASVPGVLRGLGYVVGAGVSSLSYGVALLFIAVVRFARGGGWGWQLIVGTILAALGASELTLPDVASLLVPALLVAFGVVLLSRGRR